jgi:hypothetical protein
VKGLLSGLVQAGWHGVRFAAPWSAALLFIACSAASARGAHVPMRTV